MMNKRVAKKFDIQQEQDKDELNKFVGKVIQKKKIIKDEEVPE